MSHPSHSATSKEGREPRSFRVHISPSFLPSFPAIFAAFTAPFLAAAPQGISLATCPEYVLSLGLHGPFCTYQRWVPYSRLLDIAY